jgi:hypothetical protein
MAISLWLPQILITPLKQSKINEKNNFTNELNVYTENKIIKIL